MQQTPAAPGAPVVAPVPQVTVDGTSLSSPQSIYQAFRAQRRELARQLETLEEQRQDISGQLTSTSLTAADRKGLEQRVTAVDERIANTDKLLADADAQVARAAAIPGAAVEPPPLPESGPPEEFWVLSGMFIVVVMLPLSLAYARRIWRRSAKVVTTFPKELSDRLMHVEQAVEATALEVERIGDGQRFMTKLFTEGPAAGALRGQHAQLPAQAPGQSGT